MTKTVNLFRTKCYTDVLVLWWTSVDILATSNNNHYVLAYCTCSMCNCENEIRKYYSELHQNTHSWDSISASQNA